MHHGLERAADRFGDRVAVRAGDDSWSFARPRRAGQRLRPPPGRRGASGPGDRVAVMTTNRVEFVVAVHAISKLGAAAVLLSPAWKAVEVGHAARPDRARSTRSPTAPPPRSSPTAWAATRVTDLDDAAARRGHAGRRPARAADAAVDVADDRRGGPRVQLGHDRPAQGGAPHPPLDGPRHHATGCAALGLGPDDRFQVATPPSHILGLLNLLAAAEAGATVRLHRRFDLDEVLRRIESDRMTLEMAVAPIALAMANHPRLEDYDLSSLRYIMWGATPVTESVARRGHRAHRRPVAAGLRRQRAAGDRLQPGRRARPRGGSTRPACRPTGVELRVVDLDTGAVLAAGRDRRDPGPQPVGDGRLPARTRRTPRPSPTAGTAPATSAGSSPRAGSTSPTAPRR